MNTLRKLLTAIAYLFLCLKGHGKIPHKEHYKVISLGLGQQSTALYLMSSTGYVERADFAIFSDTGAEHEETYRYLSWLKTWALKNKGIPIIHTGKKSLFKDLIAGTHSSGKRFASIPAFTKDGQGKIGMLRRQCTEEYKTQEVFKALRHIYRLHPRKRTPHTEIWLGITLEEMERMKYPRTSWLTFVYPFLNIKSHKQGHEKVVYTALLRRGDCVEWLTSRHFPVPPKSACMFCPFQADRRWLELKQHKPKEWKKVVKLDEQIRNSTQRGVKQPIYLHRSAVPLKEANLNENQLDLFISECEGMCGI